MHEILVMQELRHKNIVNYIDSFLVNDEELWVRHTMHGALLL